MFCALVQCAAREDLQKRGCAEVYSRSIPFFISWNLPQQPAHLLGTPVQVHKEVVNVNRVPFYLAQPDLETSFF